MSDVVRPAGSFRRGVRAVGAVIGWAVAVGGALVAGEVALISLQWGSDGGPFTVVASVVPGMISVVAVHLVTRGHGGGTRTAPCLLLGLVSLLLWVASLVAVFRSQSSYSSTVEHAGAPTGWIVAGGVAALGVVASSALLPARIRLRGLLIGAGLVVLLWLVPGVARALSNEAPTW